MSWVITLSIISLFIWYFFYNITDFSLLLKINPIFIVTLILVNVLSIAMNGVFMKWSISLFGKHIKLNESVKVSFISTAGNFFAPSGSGLGFRAVYLKKRHGVSYSDYISIILCNYAMVFLVSSIIGLASLYALREKASSVFVVLVIFFVTLLIASLGAFFVRVKNNNKNSIFKVRWAKKILEVLGQVSEGWDLILANKKIASKLMLLVIFITFLMVIGMYCIVSSLGLDISIPSLVLFSVLGSLSVFINITPGNLGVKEAVYIACSAVIGLTTPQILSIALVDRAVMFIVLFLLWVTYGKGMHSSLSSTENHTS